MSYERKGVFRKIWRLPMLLKAMFLTIVVYEAAFRSVETPIQMQGRFYRVGTSKTTFWGFPPRWKSHTFCDFRLKTA